MLGYNTISQWLSGYVVGQVTFYFWCSSWGQLKNPMCWCSCDWPVIYFSHFNRRLEAWFEWFLGFRISDHYSDAILTLFFKFSIARLENWNDVEIFGGPFTLFLDFDASQVVDFHPVVVVLFIGSLTWPIALLLEDGSVLVWSFRPFAWSELICCFNTEYWWAFFRRVFSFGDASWQDSGCAVELLCVVWSVPPVWEAVWFPSARSDCSFTGNSLSETHTDLG